MPDNFFGDGLIFEESLPLLWTPGPLVQGMQLARMNADNHQLLGAESSLEEARVHEALKDESPALVHELQRLEFKLNILLRLTAELSVHHHALPAAQSVRLASRGLEWFGADAPGVGSTGLLQLYINPALPQALKLNCIVAGERFVESQRAAQMRFSGVSEQVGELIDKFVFRHHRRLVAGARQAAI
jgi:hypothetical protein